MATNLDIENELLDAAMHAGGHKTKKAVTEALIEYIQKRDQASIIELFGTIPFDEDYNHKDERKRDSKRQSA